MKNRHDIVLIGPPCVGKTTIALALSNMTRLPLVSLDRLAKEFFPDIGFSEEVSDCKFNAGFVGWRRYVSKFEIKLLSIAFENFQNCIFDVGAGYVITDNCTDQENISLRALLAPFHHIIQVRLSNNVAHESSLIAHRLKRRDDSNMPQIRLNEIVQYFSERGWQYEALASSTLYTEGLSAQESAQSILDICRICR